MSTNRIRDEALLLPSDERAMLAQELLRSLDSPADSGADEAWLVEIEKRVNEVADESVQSVDWQKAKERIAKRLRERRA